jgi:DNA segregation ATPase FtsK/SpoIIIE-like protein
MMNLLAVGYGAAVVVVHDVVLMTRRQIKGAILLGIVLLVATAVAWLMFRFFSRRRPDSVMGDIPSEPFGAPEAETPPARPVDEAVANVLAHASAQEGDERTVADLIDGALRVVTDLGGVSVPALQRKLEIDFDRANELVATLEAEGYVSAPGANGKRKVLPQAYEYVEKAGE